MSSTTFWRSIEAVHDVVYFADDATARYEALGLKGYWMGYMASRSAALGTPPPEVVVAAFHGFAPALVHRALPEAWARTTRDAVLAARLDLARDRLAPVAGDAEAVGRELLAVTQGLDLAGKTLAAAHVALPAPADPVGRLWHAATAIREYRGDCHVAVLTAAGLDGCQANVLAVAAGLAPARQREVRGWSETEWEAATQRLVTRGWVTPDGGITETGRSARAQVEATTDRVCAAGMDREATARTITVEAALLEVARAVGASGGVPYPNPTAVPAP